MNRLLPACVLLVAVLLQTGSAAVFTQETKLTAPDTMGQDLFGTSVAIDGNTAVVGAITTPADESGAAYVFVRSNGVWTMQQKLLSSMPQFAGHFGRAVAVNGDTIVIGADQEDPNAGAAYVFVRTGNVWSMQQRLTPLDATIEDGFGNAVAVNGDTIAIGARAKSDGGQFGVGATYVFARSGTTWTQQQKLMAPNADENDFFGTSVGLSGETLIVGSEGDDDQGQTSGSAYVFVRSGSSWSLQQKLLASGGTEGDLFGFSASLDGDTAIIGASRAGPTASIGPGAAYVFVRSDGSWTQQQQLVGADLDDTDSFGWSVGIKNDIAVVGAPLDDHNGGNSGSAYVFTRSAGMWTLDNKLIASDAGEGKDFGDSVSVTTGAAIVGSPHFDGPPGCCPGAAYVYEPDTTPPVITSVAASPNSLWPPNHRMVPVTIAVTATDNSGDVPTCQIVSVSSNEPINGLGDGDTAPDWQITGELSVNLRAERSGTGNGRAYTLTVECTDASNNSSSDDTTVSVPHNR